MAIVTICKRIEVENIRNVNIQENAALFCKICIDWLSVNSLAVCEQFSCLWTD